MDMARTNWQRWISKPLNEAHVAGEQLQQDVGNTEWETEAKAGN